MIVSLSVLFSVYFSARLPVVMYVYVYTAASKRKKRVQSVRISTCSFTEYPSVFFSFFMSVPDSCVCIRLIVYVRVLRLNHITLHQSIQIPVYLISQYS